MGRKALAAAKLKVQELFGELLEHRVVPAQRKTPKGKTSMKTNTRRELIRLTSAIGSGLLFAGCTQSKPTGPEQKGDSNKNEAEVSPAEDLMREHGVLERVLLVYEEGLRRLDSSQDFDPAVLAESAAIVRRFIEDYHEKL